MFKITIKLLLSLLIIAVSLVAIGCDGGTARTPEEHVARANDYYDQKELHAAVIELKNALQEAPDNTEARWLLALIYLDLGNGAGAEKELRRAVEVGLTAQAAAVPLARAAFLQRKFEELVENPPDETGLSKEDREELWAIYGDAYLALGHKDEADQAYDKALSLQSDFPRAVTGKARLAVSEKDIDQARLLLGQVQKAHPDFKPAWTLLGDIERVLGNAQAAEAAYSNAINPNIPGDMNLFNRALMRIKLGDEAGARSDVASLKRQLPGNSRVAYAEGLLEFGSKNYAQAQSLFETVVRDAPDYKVAVYYLAATHYFQHNLRQAEDYGQRFLAAYPQFSPAAYLVGSIRLQLGDLEGAEAVLLPVLQRNPSDTAALELMAQVELSKGQPQESIGYLKTLTTELPDSALAYMKLGVSYFNTGETQRSAEALKTAIQLDPNLQSADVRLILNYLKAKEFDKALAAAEQLRDKQPDSPEPYTLMAGAFLGQDNEDAARQALSTALIKDPGNPMATQNLATLELQNGAPAKARALYEEALKHNPGNLSILLPLAQLDIRESRTADAIKRLEQAIDGNPSALQPRLMLAMLYQTSGQSQRVLDIMKAVPENYKEDPRVLGLTGDAQLSLKQTESAAYTIQKLAQKAPEWAQSHYLLAMLNSKRGRTVDARAELEKALELKPDHTLAKIAMTRMLMEENKPEKANRMLQELLKAYPDSPEVTALKGWLAMRQGRYAEAVTTFRETLRKRSSREVTAYLAATLMQQGDHEAAVATLKEWLAAHPADVAMQYHLARYYLITGRNDLARPVLTRVVELEPNHKAALNNLARLLREEDPADALRYAERAFNLDRDSPLVMDTLGTILLHQGQTKRALPLLRKASDKLPENLDVQYHLALALVRSGSKAEARQILTRILELDQPFGQREDAEVLLQSLEG